MTTKPRHQDDQRALLLACPACMSRPGERCTAPTDDGQREVTWLHYARTDRWADYARTNQID